MSTRRHFLRLLGTAGAGTVLGDELSYLVRRPHSILHTQYPYVTTISIAGPDLLNEKTTVWQNGKPLDNWIRITDQIMRMPIGVYGPEDEVIELKTRRVVSIPKFDSSFGLAQAKPEGGVVAYDKIPEPDEWEEKVHRSMHMGTLDREKPLLFTQGQAEPMFEDFA